MARRLLLLLTLTLALGLAVAAPAGARKGHRDHDRVTLLKASLTGENEVPGPGDADGRGTAAVALDARGRACFRIAWQGIAPPTAAHIHAGAAGVAGPIVVTFFMDRDGFTAPGLPATITAVAGCAEGLDSALLRDIRRRPENFYVNVHNADHPAGAVRGQLRRA